jgi:hypothetical protein
MCCTNSANCSARMNTYRAFLYSNRKKSCTNTTLFGRRLPPTSAGSGYRLAELPAQIIIFTSSTSNLIVLFRNLHREPPIDNLTRPDGQIVQERQDPRRRLRIGILRHGTRRLFHLWRKHLSLKCRVFLNDEIYCHAFGLQAQGRYA